MSRKHHIALISFGVITAGMLLAFLVTKGLQIPCLFQKLTGLYCPGCGNTRATIAALKLDFLSMLRFNPTYPLQMLYLLRVWVVCCKRYLQGGRFSYRPRPDRWDMLFLVFLLLWTVVRNCIPLFHPAQ